MDSSFRITDFEDIHVGAQATLRKKFTDSLLGCHAHE